MNFREKTPLTSFPYVQTFLRDVLLSTKFLVNDLALVDNLAIKYFEFRTEVEEDNFHRNMGQKIGMFLGDFEKLKKVFLVDLINSMSQFLKKSDSSADMLSEYLVKSNEIKNHLRQLMTENNHENMQPVVENVSELLYVTELAKGIHKHQRQDK